MRHFLISYDLPRSSRNKHPMATAIMNLGQAWARPLETTWFVRATMSEDEIRAKLAGMLDPESGLIVQAVSEAAVLVNTSLRWFRQRRQEAGTVNIIAFTAGAPGSAASPDFPLAQAG